MAQFEIVRSGWFAFKLTKLYGKKSHLLSRYSTEYQHCHRHCLFLNRFSREIGVLQSTPVQTRCKKKTNPDHQKFSGGESPFYRRDLPPRGPTYNFQAVIRCTLCWSPLCPLSLQMQGAWDEGLTKFCSLRSILLLSHFHRNFCDFFTFSFTLSDSLCSTLIFPRFLTRRTGDCYCHCVCEDWRAGLACLFATSQNQGNIKEIRIVWVESRQFVVNCIRSIIVQSWEEVVAFTLLLTGHFAPQNRCDTNILFCLSRSKLWFFAALKTYACVERT